MKVKGSNDELRATSIESFAQLIGGGGVDVMIIWPRSIRRKCQIICDVDVVAMKQRTDGGGVLMFKWLIEAVATI